MRLPKNMCVFFFLRVLFFCLGLDGGLGTSSAGFGGKPGLTGDTGCILYRGILIAGLVSWDGNERCRSGES